MLARVLFSACALVLFGSATITAQDEKPDRQLNERVLGQVKKSLKKFEKELGEEKIAGILKNVQAALEGNRFEFKRLQLDPSKLLESAELSQEARIEALKKLKLFHGDDDAKIDFRFEFGGDRKMIGVLLVEDDNLKIKEVVKDGPAQKAGLQAGDRIVSINGKKIEKLEELLNSVNKSKGKVKIGVRRGDKDDLVVEVEPQKGSPSAKIMRKMIDLSKDGHQLDIETLKKGDFSDLQKLIPGLKTGPIKIEKLMTEPNKELAESIQQMQKQLKELQNQIKELKKQEK